MSWSLDRIIALPGVRWAVQLSPEGEVTSQVTRGEIDHSLTRQLAQETLQRARELAREHTLGIVHTFSIRTGDIGALVAVDSDSTLVLVLEPDADLEFLREELHHE